MPRTIVLNWNSPPKRLRLTSWLQDLWLRLTQKPMSTEDWYAADCPPYPGQKRWMSVRELEDRMTAITREP